MLTLSQVQGQDGTGLNIHDHLLIRESRYYMGVTPEHYEGSPYLNDTFLSGTVYTGSQKIPLPLRYNIVMDVMEFQHQRQTFLLDPDPRILKIQVGDAVFVVDNVKGPAQKEFGFLELLGSGKFTLLAKKMVNYREKIVISDVPAKYSRSPDQYYFRIDGGSLEKVTNINNLLDHLPEKKEEVQRFVKGGKLSLKNRDDLVKLTNFYNSLFTVN
ncbi:MAG: hypothetical protein WA874_14000 [Chryseosolibacter sp.]